MTSDYGLRPWTPLGHSPETPHPRSPWSLECGRSHLKRCWCSGSDIRQNANPSLSDAMELQIWCRDLKQLRWSFFESMTWLRVHLEQPSTLVQGDIHVSGESYCFSLCNFETIQVAAASNWDLVYATTLAMWFGHTWAYAYAWMYADDFNKLYLYLDVKL